MFLWTTFCPCLFTSFIYALLFESFSSGSFKTSVSEPYFLWYFNDLFLGKIYLSIYLRGILMSIRSQILHYDDNYFTTDQNKHLCTILVLLGINLHYIWCKFNILINFFLLKQHQHQSIKNHYIKYSISTFLVQIRCSFNVPIASSVY